MEHSDRKTKIKSISASSLKTPQIERFIETARLLGCDEDKEKFELQIGKIAKAKHEEDSLKLRQKKSQLKRDGA